MIDCIALACCRVESTRIVIHQLAPLHPPFPSAPPSHAHLPPLSFAPPPSHSFRLWLSALCSAILFMAHCHLPWLMPAQLPPLPLLSPHPPLSRSIAHFYVFDVLADIAKQLSSHVSYRPEFPCHRALLVFGLRLRLCFGGSSAHTKYFWSIITGR